MRTMAELSDLSTCIHQNGVTDENGYVLDLFRDLPDEVWEAIFDKVTDPQDWLNLSRTISQFQGLIHRQRTVVLFPEVLRHVDDYLCKNDVLNCRLVCRKWKVAVDRRAEEELAKPEVLNRHYRFRFQYRFQTTETVQRFLHIMHQNSGNPFIGKYVEFSTHKCNDNLERVEDYFRRTIELLTRFGKYVRFLSLLGHIKYWEDALAETELTRTTIWFAECLRLVPNLEILYIFQTTGIENYTSVEESIRAYIGTNPMPKLHKLERLSVTAFEGIEDIWKACCCSEKMKQVAFDNLPEDHPNEYPNIDVINIDNDIEDLRIMRSSHWPLKVLTIEDSPTSLIDLFLVIERFTDTLTKLKLRFQLELTRENSGLTLKLSHLKQIHLTDLNCSLQFLQCPLLEEITILFNSPTRQENYKREEDPYDWNKWLVFPKLKILRFLTRPRPRRPRYEKRVYRRERFEYLRQHQDLTSILTIVPA